MSDIDETRQQTVDLIQEIQHAKAEAQDLCKGLRRQIWENKKILDGPALSPATRENIEDALFEYMKMLNQSEESIARHDESIADLRYSLQRLDTASDNENTAVILFGVLIFLCVIAFVLYLLFS